MLVARKALIYQAIARTQMEAEDPKELYDSTITQMYGGSYRNSAGGPSITLGVLRAEARTRLAVLRRALG